MAIEVTPHDGRPTDAGSLVDALRAQPSGAAGAMFTVADAAVSQPVARSGLYRIFAVSTVRVRAGLQADGTPLPNASGGAAMVADGVEVWWLNKGEVIACDARA